MRESRRLPFHNMTPEGWLNLALSGLAVFYAIQIGLDVVWHNLCGHLGVDFCAFWSAGQIANTSGYANIYDLGHLERVERSLFPTFGDPATFALSPIAYLPVFMVPFQLLSLLPPATSFWVWTLVNVGALASYLRYFSMKTTGNAPPGRLLGMLLLCLPVFWNVLDGQVNVWLTICLGEFMRAMLSSKPFRSGLWLGGLLLKPQYLILLVIALCLQRSIRSLAGLAMASGALLTASLVLAGSTGIVRMTQVWLGFAQGIPTNYVEIMMNWRMLGVHLESLFGPLIGWAIAGIGIVATSIFALFLWRKPIMRDSQLFSIALLGTLAATGTVAWHSHIPSAMMLIPPLLLLQQQGRLPKKALEYWVFLPVIAYVFALSLAVLIHMRQGADSSIIATSGLLNFMRGSSEFGLNLYLLFWAVRQLRPFVRPRPSGV